MRAATTLKTEGQVWVSIARYDDELVETLEGWEKHTRGPSLGRRKEGSDQMDGGERLADLFQTDKWDQNKMVRSFARLGTIEQSSIKHDEAEGKKVYEHTLLPLTGAKWESLKQEIEATDRQKKAPPQGENQIPSEEGSMEDLTKSLPSSNIGVVVDANRELRVKLYMGQVFMGWLWFVPAFHMTPPSPSDPSDKQSTLHLQKSELDFALGIGANIVDLEILMEWCTPSSESDGSGVGSADDILAPPARQTSEDSRAGKGGEPAGLAATLKAVVHMSEGNVHEAVEAKQAAED